MTHRIALLPGDGVGPEVVGEARRCVDELGLELEWSELDWGSDHWVGHGLMMPPDAVERLRAFDAVLLGAVGRPDIPDDVTLWGLLLPIRQRLDLWANVRPVRLLEGVPCALAGRSPGDIDMLFVRENSEGEYSGVGGRAHQGLAGEVGIETAVFTRAGIERVVEHAFRLAGERRGLVTERDQVQRLALRLRALGRGRRGGRRAPPRHPLRARARGRARGAHGAAARQPRRRRRLQPLRRHPDRSGRGAAGRHGHGREREPLPGRRRAGTVRARARLGARHRRPGRREPVRSRLERRPDARLTSASRRPRRACWPRSRPCAGKARARATSAGARGRPRSARRSAPACGRSRRRCAGRPYARPGNMLRAGPQARSAMIRAMARHPVAGFSRYRADGL